MISLIFVGMGCLITGGATEVRPDEAPRKLADWYVTRPPDLDKEQHLVANHDSRRNYVVALDGGEAVATVAWEHRPHPVPFAITIPPDDPQAPGSKTTRSEVRVADGWIESFFAGEFGGSVWWFAPDGKARYKISDEMVVGFVPTPAGVLMLEGLAHLDSSRGSLRRLVRGPDDRWTSKPFADLGDAPGVAALIDDESLLVVSLGRLSRVDLNTRQVEILVDNAFWQSLYPNSIVIVPSGQVFLGMRHGVARLDKIGASPKIDWLLPSQAVADEKFIPE